MNVIKIVFLFLGILFTIANTYRTVLKNDIPAINVILQTIGIVGFIVCHWNLLS